MEEQDKTKERLAVEIAELRHRLAGLAAPRGEQKLRSTIEESEDGIILVDEQGKIVEWSPAQERITGLKRAEALGRAFWDIQFQVASEKKRTPAVYRQGRLRMLDLLRTGQVPQSGQFEEREIQRPDGARRIIRSLLLPISTHGGWMAGAIWRDVTERPSAQGPRTRAEDALQEDSDEIDSILKRRITALAKANELLREKLKEHERIERALRKSEKRYALATSAGHVGIWDWNTETNEVYLDPGLKTMLGYEDHEVGNHLDDWHRLLHPGDAARVVTEASARLGGSSSHYEIVYRMLHRDGSTRWFIERGIVMRRANEKAYRIVGADIDITSQKKAEEDMRRLSGEIEERVRQGVVALRDAKAQLEHQVAERQRAEKALGLAHDELEERVAERTADLARANAVLKQKIAERKGAEEKLRRDCDGLVSILDAMEDGVYVIDEDYEIEYANRSMRERFGSFEGTKCYQYLHGREDICPWCLDQNDLAEETAHSEQHCARGERTYELIETRLRGLAGDLSKLGIARDITERKRLEDTLRESEANWQSLVKNAPDTVLTVNPGGAILFINRTPAGVNVKDVVGTNITEYVRAKYRATIKESIQRVYNSGQSEYCEIPARGPYDKTSWYATQLGPIKRGDAVVAVMLVSRDITKRRRAQDQLLKARDELELRVYERTAALLQANAQLEQEIGERKRAQEEILVYQGKLRSLGSELQLAEERERRRIATDLHDQIGQTLALCKMKASVLREAATTADLAESLDEIRAMTETAIAYARSLTYQLSPPILYELGLEAAVEWLGEDLLEGNGVTCNFEIDAQPKPLDDDVRVLLFRAVRELFVNIVKHAHAHKATVSIRRDGQEIEILVEDDGIGFDKSRVHTRSPQKGGFGLFLYRERLSYLGGRFQVETSPGEGTRVTLAAPLRRDQEAGREEDHGHNGPVG